jgi:hypothetical protein
MLQPARRPAFPRPVSTAIAARSSRCNAPRSLGHECHLHEPSVLDNMQCCHGHRVVADRAEPFGVALAERLRSFDIAISRPKSAANPDNGPATPIVRVEVELAASASTVDPPLSDSDSRHGASDDEKRRT